VQQLPFDLPSAHPGCILQVCLVMHLPSIYGGLHLARSLPPGTAVFNNISAWCAIRDLRGLLQELGVPNAKKYRTHDFRRGHTQDLAEGGSHLSEIYLAGQWSAVKSYLDLAKVEELAVHDTHNISSSDDEEADLCDVSD